MKNKSLPATSTPATITTRNKTNSTPAIKTNTNKITHISANKTIINETITKVTCSEPFTMTAKLDISLALKLVKPFDGTNTLINPYIESVELLLDYAEKVPEVDIVKFMKTTLVLLMES